MKITKRQLKRIIKEEKAKILEGRQGGIWAQCMDALVQMALAHGYVCCLCAAQAISQCSGQTAGMELCCQLIDDCCSGGHLKPRPHPELANVTVYSIG